MRRITPIAGLVLLLLGAWWLYRMWFPPDETVIRRILGEAAEAASARPNEGPFEKLGAINRILEACTVDVVVAINMPGVGAEAIHGRDQLRETLTAWRGAAEDATITLIDLAVEVREDRSAASAQFIARARFGGQADDFLQEIRITLNRAEGRWKIQRVEPLASLEM